MRARLVLGFAVCFALRAEDITPRVGDIEIYGARKVPLKKIRSAIGAKEGDALPARQDVEDRIDKISGITASRVEAACCDGRKMILYVGVEEKTTPHFEFHKAPAGDVTLPAELAGNYRSFLDEVAESIRAHNTDEDLTNGYSLMADPACRQLQQTFIPFVAQDLPLIDRVVRESADSEQRAMAAYLLQYGRANSSRCQNDGRWTSIRSAGSRTIPFARMRCELYGRSLWGHGFTPNNRFI